jgi:hypothetical protein
LQTTLQHEASERKLPGEDLLAGLADPPPLLVALARLGAGPVDHSRGHPNGPLKDYGLYGNCPLPHPPKHPLPDLGRRKADHKRQIANYEQVVEQRQKVVREAQERVSKDPEGCHPRTSSWHAPETYREALRRAQESLEWARGELERVQKQDVGQPYRKELNRLQQLNAEAEATAYRVRVLGDVPVFEGTVALLLQALNALRRCEGEYNLGDWPRTPKALGGELRRYAPNLARVGVELRHLGRSRDGSRIRLASRTSPEPSAAPGEAA